MSSDFLTRPGGVVEAIGFFRLARLARSVLVTTLKKKITNYYIFVKKKIKFFSTLQK
jgi:hypothetical protein